MLRTINQTRCNKDIQNAALIHSRLVDLLHHTSVALINSCITNQLCLYGEEEEVWATGRDFFLGNNRWVPSFGLNEEREQLFDAISEVERAKVIFLKNRGFKEKLWSFESGDGVTRLESKFYLGVTFCPEEGGEYSKRNCFRD